MQNRQRTGCPKALKHKFKKPKDNTIILWNYAAKYLLKDITPQTIWYTSRKSGYRARTARKKPFVSKINRLKRLTFGENTY